MFECEIFEVEGDASWALERVSAGPGLAEAVSAVDPADLSGHGRVLLLRATQRVVSHYTALLYQTMVSIRHAMEDVGFDDTRVEWEGAAAEIRAALRLTRASAAARLSLAEEACERLPAVADALTAGVIDPPRARVIIDAVSHLSTAAARRVVAGIVDDAGGWTTGQLRARLRRLCIDADPDTARDRYREATADRRVTVEATVDGTATLIGVGLAPQRVTAAMNHLNHLARTRRGDGEERTMDQLRADLLLDLLTGHHATDTTGAGTGSDTGGRVVITADAATLAELTDHSCDLAGYGPVIADVARQFAATPTGRTWQWAITHPDTGSLLATGTTRRRPTAALRRHVETRNPHCVYPGCRMPATSCDLDHRIPVADGGDTHPDNLAPLCRHDHHTVRHQLGWTYQPLHNGDYLWTSPLGHPYTTSGRSP